MSVQPGLPFDGPVDDQPTGVPGLAFDHSPAPPLERRPTKPGRGSGAGVFDVDFVRHPRARRYQIRVREDGSVRVTIPRRGSKREASAFLQDKRAWVAAQQRRLTEERRRIPPDLSPVEQRALLERARLELPTRLRELACALGLTVRKVSIRNQRHRWGSCSRAGDISLNWRLVTMPGAVRDYVLYHELMHLKRLDHSPAFWCLVEEVCPHYREARAWLRRYARAPHAAPHDAAPPVSGGSAADPVA